MKVKVLHWNVWWKEDVENVLRVLREVDADVLLLQEVTVGCEHNDGGDVAEMIAKETGFDYNFVIANDYGENVSGNAIFSRFPIVEKYNFFIREVESMRDYSAENKNCVAVKVLLDDKKEGD